MKSSCAHGATSLDLQIGGDVVVVAIATVVLPESGEIGLPVSGTGRGRIQIGLAVSEAWKAWRRMLDPLRLERDPRCQNDRKADQ